MKWDSSIRKTDVGVHRQWRPTGLLKYSHSIALVVFSMYLVLFMAPVAETAEDLRLNPNLHQRLHYGESGYNNVVNDGTRFETARGLRFFAAKEPVVNPYLNYLAVKPDDNRRKQINSDFQSGEQLSTSPTSPDLFSTVRTKKGFNAIKSLMGLQSRSLSRSVSMARSVSTEDYIEPAMQTRRTMVRQYRPRLRWG